MPRDRILCAVELPTNIPHATRCGPVAPSKRGRVRALVLVAVHIAVLAHVAHWKIAGTTLTPLEPSEAMQTLELGYVNAGFIVFALLIVSTLIFGRFFCGWACHVVAYQDLCAWVLGKLRLRPRPFRSRLLMLVPMGAALYMFAWPTIERAWASRAAPAFAAHFTTDSFWRTFPGPGIALLTILVDGFLIVWFLGAKGFCTYGCPYGAIFGVADRIAPGKIRVNDACEGCGHCTAVCTSNVRVHEEVAAYGMVVDSGCMKCLDCVTACPKEALSFGFGAPAVAKPASSRRPPKRTYDLSWPGEVTLAAVFCLALYAFRDLYDVVPFLLAIGLASVTAFLGITAVRLVGASDFRLQSLTLRRDGAWTRAGVLTAASIVLWLLFAGHSAFVQWETRTGKALVRQARDLPRAERGALVDSALAHLSTAERWGLTQTGELQLYLGNAHRYVERWPQAEACLRRATTLNPEFTGARMDLATVLMILGDRDGARSQLRAILDTKPQNEGDVQVRRLAATRLDQMNAPPNPR